MTLLYDSLFPYDTSYSYDGEATWVDICFPFGEWAANPGTLGETDGTATWGDDSCS